MPPETPEEKAAREAAAPQEPTTSNEPAAGPWSKDLAETFEDEGVRAQVDEFLRGKVQPHVTQLETKAANSGNEEAERLYNDFQEDPEGTYLALTTELFGKEFAEELVNSLQGEAQEGDEEEPPEPEAEGDEDDDLEKLPPQVREMIEEREEQQAREQYDAELARLKEQDPQLNEKWFAPFVVTAEGDMDLAYEGYKAWIDDAQPQAGKEGDVDAAAAEAAENVDPNAEAPPTIGSDSQGTSTPPTEKNYETLDDAMDDFFAENRGGPAPPVGAA